MTMCGNVRDCCGYSHFTGSVLRWFILLIEPAEVLLRVVTLPPTISRAPGMRAWL